MRSLLLKTLPLATLLVLLSACQRATTPGTAVAAPTATKETKAAGSDNAQFAFAEVGIDELQARMGRGELTSHALTQAYLARMHQEMELRHFLIGMSKAPLFAMVIGLIGCLEGMQVKGTAQSVGERTTSAVVQTISLVIVFDAFAAIWFMYMDW